MENDREEVMDELEKQQFKKTIAAFRMYKHHALKHVTASETFYKEFSSFHQQLVPNFMDTLGKLRECINHNAEIINLILKNADPEMFENNKNGNKGGGDEGWKSPTGTGARMGVTANDMDKVRSTLKQFVRDWSKEGAPEREICYQPVIEEVQELFSTDIYNPREVHVLVPGAGLGRLAWEIARLGYTCQGNEWSLYMLFPSYFILNTCKRIEMLKLFPWASQYSNNMTRADQLRAVAFPDVNPSELPQGANFSMAAGDFLDVYTDAECWDCVATVFFIDTAHNILAYLEAIWRMLKPGGYWINMGPLLYHFAEMQGEASIELSYDELRPAIVNIGFEFVKEKTGVKSGYTQQPSSMLSYQYNCVFFVVRKPLLPSRSSQDSPMGDEDQ